MIAMALQNILGRLTTMSRQVGGCDLSLLLLVFCTSVRQVIQSSPIQFYEIKCCWWTLFLSSERNSLLSFPVNNEKNSGGWLIKRKSRLTFTKNDAAFQSILHFFCEKMAVSKCRQRSDDENGIKCKMANKIRHWIHCFKKSTPTGNSHEKHRMIFQDERNF